MRGILPFRPYSSYCFTKRIASTPAKNVATTSASRRIWLRNGAKSALPNGG